MTRMHAGAAAGLIAASLLVGGCLHGNRPVISNCRPVADETGLLDEYAHDPVFDIRPAGVRDVSEKNRSLACNVDPDWPDDPSETAVDMQLSMSRDYDAEALIEVYEPAVTGRGWRRVTAAGPASTSAPASAPAARRDPVVLRYCAQVRGVTSLLSVHVPDLTAEAGVRGPRGATVSPTPRVVSRPGPIFVRIAAAPDQPSCP